MAKGPGADSRGLAWCRSTNRKAFGNRSGPKSFPSPDCTAGGSFCPEVVSFQQPCAGSAGTGGLTQTRGYQASGSSLSVSKPSRCLQKGSQGLNHPPSSVLHGCVQPHHQSVFCECKIFNPTPSGAHLPSYLLPILIWNGAGEQIRKGRDSREAEDGNADWDDGEGGQRQTLPMLRIQLCTPPQRYMKSYPPGPVNVTSFGVGILQL
ncbi:uncharacterized protein LOC125102353 [Lutra lutra]|uniref:uncharacterized protein LOC125102353 n=1 Tax=Lutra lutra TaxID=9657 RepID=UPI001FD4E20B|nr:uncharacterized protein LOC125102353 [Lutra lutra]